MAKDKKTKNNRSAVFSRLKKIFNFTSGTLPDTNVRIPVPAETLPDGRQRKVKFRDENLKLLKYWISDTYDNAETLKNRFERYRSLEFAYYNNSIFSKAINLYADETVQQDVQNETVDIDAADKKVANYIKELFDILEITSDRIRDTAFSLALYGDSFWIMPSEDEKGYVEAIPADIYNVQDRFEFNASEESRKKAKKRSYGEFVSKNTRLKVLDQLISNPTNDFSKFFQTYLFGYQLDKDIFLPPWNILHFRMFNTQSEFAPFGRPLMVNALAPFRQLQSSKNLMALARATGFPIKVFEVNVDETMDPVTKWETVNLAREQFANLGVESTGKEQFAMQSEVWLPKDTIDFTSYDSKVNMDQIADVEMLRDDLIMATDIPKGYLIVDRGAFGTSSQALLAQHKPFARKVYHIQSAILKQLSQMVRLHFTMTSAFDYDTPFQLTMAFPSTEESSDRLRIKSDTLRLAKDVVDAIGQAVGLERDEALPPEIVKQIFSQLSFLDGEEVEEWIDEIVSSRKVVESVKLSEDHDKRLNECMKTSFLKETYFKIIKKLNFQEGVIGQKHLYTSTKIDPHERIYLDLFDQSTKKING